jgi:hypothetical protein
MKNAFLSENQGWNKFICLLSSFKNFAIILEDEIQKGDGGNRTHE